ncbi:MAG: hypothetical protein KF767_12975 [Bdellovibrionaceae bacterium]|nr:hypothetical protein [Pseudobdellovibrionaceae bacterium]
MEKTTTQMLIRILALLVLPLPLWAKKVCLHEVQVNGAAYSGFGSPRLPYVERAAWYMKNEKAGAGCVGIREAEGGEWTQNEATVNVKQIKLNVLMNGAPMDSAAIAKLTKIMCVGGGDKCKAKVSYTCHSLGELSLRSRAQAGAKKGKIGADKLGSMDKLPRFDETCTDPDVGANPMKMNADTRAFFENLGLDPKTTEPFDLALGSKSVLKLGFIDPSSVGSSTSAPASAAPEADSGTR